MDEVKTSKEFISIMAKADRLKDCNSRWIIDKYELSRMKDFKKTNLCRDRFCSNCKKVKQAQRMEKYMKLFADYDEDLYFITLTVPNCAAVNLKDTIKNMFNAFFKLIQYFDGRKKIKGVDFEKFGYIGAIRNLEITFKLDGRHRFHPHLHAAFVLKGYKPGKKYIYTRFSKDNSGRRAVRLFTQDEWRMQRIWFLLINHIRVTKDSLHICNYQYQIDGVTKEKTIENKGYSVVIDKFKPGQYQEMFKYMIKDKSMNGDDMDYDTFKVFYYALDRVRQLAGYGEFQDVDDDSLVDENDVDERYNKIIYFLRMKESPVRVTETIEDVKKNIYDCKYIYISRKKIFSYLRKCILEERFGDVEQEKETDTFIDYDYYENMCQEILGIKRGVSC
jgi:hypothetical protein